MWTYEKRYLWTYKNFQNAIWQLGRRSGKHIPEGFFFAVRKFVEDVLYYASTEELAKRSCNQIIKWSRYE
jgi:hypothetical protein